MELLHAHDPSLNPKAPSSPLDLDAIPVDDLMKDNEFLNSLQSSVNGWIKELSNLTSLTLSTPFPNDAIEEKVRIECTLISPPLSFTLLIRRFAP